jgi:hypothetical protein
LGTSVARGNRKGAEDGATEANAVWESKSSQLPNVLIGRGSMSRWHKERATSWRVASIALLQRFDFLSKAFLSKSQ